MNSNWLFTLKNRYRKRFAGGRRVGVIDANANVALYYNDEERCISIVCRQSSSTNNSYIYLRNIFVFNQIFTNTNFSIVPRLASPFVPHTSSSCFCYVPRCRPILYIRRVTFKYVDRFGSMFIPCCCKLSFFIEFVSRTPNAIYLLHTRTSQARHEYIKDGNKTYVRDDFWHMTYSIIRIGMWIALHIGFRYAEYRYQRRYMKNFHTWQACTLSAHIIKYLPDGIVSIVWKLVLAGIIQPCPNEWFVSWSENSLFFLSSLRIENVTIANWKSFHRRCSVFASRWRGFPPTSFVYK